MLNLIIDITMRITVRKLKYASVFLFFVLFTGPGCASAKKNVFSLKQKEALCDLSRLGKNKYFYSGAYQRKLTKSIRKIKTQ